MTMPGLCPRRTVQAPPAESDRCDTAQQCATVGLVTSLTLSPGPGDSESNSNAAAIGTVTQTNLHLEHWQDHDDLRA